MYNLYFDRTLYPDGQHYVTVHLVGAPHPGCRQRSENEDQGWWESSDTPLEIGSQIVRRGTTFTVKDCKNYGCMRSRKVR